MGEGSKQFSVNLYRGDLEDFHDYIVELWTDQQGTMHRPYDLPSLVLRNPDSMVEEVRQWTDEQGRAHRESGPALEVNTTDGYRVWFEHGTPTYIEYPTSFEFDQLGNVVSAHYSGEKQEVNANSLPSLEI